ncbi:MAG: hypothetical protein DBY35_08380 [Bacteroidales bacterium]|nr:MAG: hypothetical protein DBY35_08380 [Bacteroidales bacterium]
MNKKLLALAAIAAMSVSSISAAEVSLLDANSIHGNASNLSGWGAQVEAVDGVYTLEVGANLANPWDAQLFICGNKTLNAGQKITFKMQAKSTSARALQTQAQGDMGGYLANLGPDFEVAADWKSYEFTGEVPVDGMKTIAVNLATAPEACTISFKDIVWTVEESGDTPDPKPEQPADVVASWYTGNGATFGGWGGSATFEQVTEDDKPCLKVTNPSEGTNPWDVQVGIDVNLDFDKTYYLSFDVKGTSAEGITSGIQNSTDYDGKGNFTAFNITEDWAPVVIEALCSQGNKESDANRITINLGKYVGTFYMTNVVLSTTNPAGVDAVEVAPVVNHWTVYNLMGVKVLDTDNEAAVNELANGIYVINGKKVAIRH